MINSFINEITYLFVEISPYLILGFLVSGFLFIFTSKEMVANNLGKPGFISVSKASLFGVPMPLCSCGVIPVATSMHKRGASKGATLSFLISTPQTGIDSILLTLNQMGLQFAIVRPIVALLTGVIGGLIGVIIGTTLLYLLANLNDWPFALPIGAIFGSITFSAMVGLFFGILPARRAAKLDPAISLRYE